MGQQQQRRPAGLEQLPAQLHELPGPDDDRAALGDVRSCPTTATAAHLRRADDDVRQPQIPRPAQHPGRRPGKLPRAVGEGGGEPALVLRRDPGRAARRPETAEAGAGPSSAAVRRRRTGNRWPSWPHATRGVVEAAVHAWAADRATDDDVRWLDVLLRRGLLGNSVQQTPRLEELAARVSRRREASWRCRGSFRAWRTSAPASSSRSSSAAMLQPGEPVPRRYLEVLSTPGTSRSRPRAAAGWSWPSRSPAPTIR